VDLIFSTHALDRMVERTIAWWEVEEALRHVERETAGATPDRVNRWGRTIGGRRLRITQYLNAPDFVITVVAIGEEEP
jgi:hypothetical protein